MTNLRVTFLAFAKIEITFAIFFIVADIYEYKQYFKEIL